jgi:type II secretory pathway component PulF
LTLLLAIGVLVLITLIDRKKRLLHVFHRWLLRLPIVGSLLMKAGIAQASAMLETMLRSGLPLDEAIQITGRSIRNPLLREELISIAAAVRTGRPLAEAAQTNALLPPVVIHMLAIGEQSGQIEDMLGELATAFDGDVDVAARQAIGVLEPALIIVISIVVGFIVLATILPIVRISGSF